MRALVDVGQLNERERSEPLPLVTTCTYIHRRVDDVESERRATKNAPRRARSSSRLSLVSGLR
jgi:hypothetical protein